MNELKKHLRQARQEYDSQHYPGDLSADVLGPKRGWLWTAGTIAAAAAAVLLVLLWPGGSAPPTEVVDQQPAPTTSQAVADATEEEPDETADVSLAEVPSLSMPLIPAEMYFSASLPDLSISPPSITLVGLETEQSQEQQSTSTTREAV